MTVGTILAGGAVFRAGVEESNQLTGEANKLAKALAISTTEASALNVALGDIYSSADSMVSAAGALARQIRTNEAALNNMGLVTRDANGNLRNMRDLVMDGTKVLAGYKEGTDRTLAAQVMFRGAIGEAISLMKLNDETIEAAKQKQQELGLVIGVENVEATKAYKAAMNDVGDVMSAIRKAIGDAVMPVLTKLGEWFSSIGPAAVTVVKGAIGGLVSTFWGLKFAAEAVWNGIAYVIEMVTVKILRFADTAMHALSLDFAGAKDAWERGTQQLEEIADKRLKNVMDSAEETREKLWNLFANPTDTPAKEAKGKSFTDPKPEKDKKDKVESRMPEWEAQLAQQKAAYMRSHDMYEMSLEDEKKYWDTLLSTLDTGAKEYGAVRKKSADLELQILKKKAQEGRAIAQEEIEEWKRNATAGIDLQQQAAQQAYALGQISKEELLNQERQFEEERYQIARQAVEERMALLAKDPNMNPVEYQKLKNQLLEIDRKHALEKRAIENKIQLEQAAPALNVFKSLETSFGQAITGMITRAQTLRQALGNIFRSIANTFITEVVAKPLAESAIGLIRQTGLYQTFFGIKKGLVASDAAAKAAADSTAATSSAAKAAAVIPAEAGVAAAEGAAAVAPIPIVGPALAAAAFASIMAMVMGALSGGGGGGGSSSGFSPSLPSAEGGWDIPAGATGLMRFHEREMMLPQPYADVIRGLANGGSPGGGEVHNHYNIQAWDSRDVANFLQRNRKHVAAAMQSVHRDFGIKKS